MTRSSYVSSPAGQSGGVGGCREAAEEAASGESPGGPAECRWSRVCGCKTADCRGRGRRGRMSRGERAAGRRASRAGRESRAWGRARRPGRPGSEATPRPWWWARCRCGGRGAAWRGQLRAGAPPPLLPTAPPTQTRLPSNSSTYPYKYPQIKRRDLWG